MNKTKTLTSALLTILVLTSLIAAGDGTNNPVQNDTTIDYVEWDVDGDNKVTKADIEFLIAYLFEDGPSPNPLERADFDKVDSVDIGDLTLLINYLRENDLLDDEAPEIELLNPDDEDVFKTDKDEKEIDFEFIVRDDSEIQACSLIIDGDVEATKNNPERDTKLVFSMDLERGEEYEWKIKCTDIYGNEAVSEERDLEIKKRTTDSDQDTRILNPQDKKTETKTFTYPQDSIVLNEKPAKTFAEKIDWKLAVIIFIIIDLIILIILIGVAIYKRY